MDIAVAVARTRRTARIGLSGGHGAGKTALIEQAVPQLLARAVEVGVIADDEATEALSRSCVVPAGRVVRIAYRQDPASSANAQMPNGRAARQLVERFPALDLIVVESRRQAASSLYADAFLDGWITVVDATRQRSAAGLEETDVVECDLLVVNKIDLAAAADVDLRRVLDAATRLRAGRPTLSANCLTGEGVGAVLDWLAHAVQLHAERIS